MIDELDGIVGSAIDVLRELPAVRDDAKARLIIAIAAERQRDADGVRTVRGRRWLWSSLGAVAAVLLAMLMVPATRPRTAAPVPVSARGAGGAPVVLTSTNSASAAEAPRPVELVFSAPNARSVRVAGDFNGWDEARSPMVRDAASGLWSARVMLRPGRHVYAFVVNDTQWVRDPRAPAAPDADFGRPGSVVLVGRP